MTESCLIDFSTLKKGDVVYHILKGWSTVVQIHHITISSTNQIQLRSDTRNYNYYLNADGKETKSDVIPAIYKYSPFEKAAQEVAYANKKLAESEKELSEYRHKEEMKNNLPF